VSNALRTQTVFGRRNEPHTIIIAHGDNFRHFTVRPWAMAALGTVAVCFSLGYLMATSYLVFRDDLIGGSIARQARMQHAYEDRISALRSQVDRIISRQLLDQQLMEQKVAELMERQNALLDRASRLGPLMERAIGADTPPLPTARPESNQRASLANPALDPIATGSVTGTAGTGYALADQADVTFSEISRSIKSIETTQIERMQALASGAAQTAEAVVEVLADAGVAIDLDQSASGGPFIAADGATDIFETTVQELDAALTRLDLIRDEVSRVPVGNPVPGQSVSSSFGYRTDPLLGTRAFHAGIDFRGPTGTAVRASAEGVVAFAGANGGYGKMVEIRHPSGLTSRYAHLSAIHVSQGEQVQAGVRIGEIGSTGRSTGPHLHYEVRRDDDARDPAPFLKAGKRIAGML
jgi:murein DD-endopeptidase MepM/ murein hydrolase activator NlpD